MRDHEVVPVDTGLVPVDASLERFGLPKNARDDSPLAVNICPPQSNPVELVSMVAMAMIATRNYLSFVRVLVRSFVCLHPEIPVRLLLVDGDEADRSALDGVEVNILEDLCLDYAGFYLAKFDATQFSNALKPTFLKYLGCRHDAIIYFDTDIAIFSPVTRMLEALAEHDLVAIPHTFSPFDKPERFWVHPTSADIFNSGLINAGCFGIRPRKCQKFLEFWETSNFAPGAFYDAAGGQTDQQYFNWSSLLVERYYVLKDRAYNVAYWNIHERGLRWGALDGGGSSTWTVDGMPLVFFHFSGFSPLEKLTLSRHDGRYLVYNIPAIAEILKWYSDQLFASDYLSLSMAAYRFDHLGNGVALNKFIRNILNKYETYIPRFDCRTAEGADRLCAFLMTPLPATGSLLPLLATEIYDSRPDLIGAFPNAHVAPLASTRYWSWFLQNAGPEYDIHDFVSRFRRVLRSDSLVGFASDIAGLVGGKRFACAFLGESRDAAAEYLRAIGRPELADSLLQGVNEIGFSTNMSAIITVYESRPDLRRDFAGIFGEAHDRFGDWLSKHGIVEHNIPWSAVEDFKTRSWNITLARIFSFLSRRDDLGDLARRVLLSDKPEELFRALIRAAGDGLEYDLADVEILIFLQKYERHVLVPLYLELPCIRRLPVSSRLSSNKSDLLPPEVRDQQWAAYGCSMHEDYCDEFSALLEEEIKKRTTASGAINKTVADYLRADDTSRSAAQVIAPAFRAAQKRYKAKPLPNSAVARSGSTKRLNIMGFFYADTGVGESSRGLADACDEIANVSRVPLCTGSVTNGVLLHQLFHRYDYLSLCNVIVSYPHQYEDFFGMLPREYMHGRHNIIHLAWEQRDWNPHWQRVYDRYDEIWAISEFAAEPFRRLFGDRVRVIPNVIAPVPGTEKINLGARETGNDPFRFTFVFDANSSIERKNPEAVLDAFLLAFQGSPHENDVQLYLKVGNMHRLEHAPRVQALQARAARSGLNIVFDGRTLTRLELLSVIASSGCYVSLHRSEGFGYTMAEAMWHGVPVVASRYSGNLEYMTEENSFLVPCREILVREADGPFQRGSIWAEPDIDLAAEQLRRVYLDRGAAQAVGSAGQLHVQAYLSASAVSQRISTSPIVSSL